MSEATIRARAELHRIVRALRASGGPWDGVQIVATPEQIGIRDGRRLVPRSTVGFDLEACLDGSSKTLMASEGIIRQEFQPDMNFGNLGAYWFGGA